MALPKRLLLTALAIAGTPAGEALAENPQRAESAEAVQTGKDLAVSLCSPCHIVSAQTSGKRPSRSVAPSFMEIAQGSKAAPEALRGFLRSTSSSVAHPTAMPHLELTDEQIGAIAAYFSSLRQTQ
jgi:mono/diheme cytochrome c family protein